MLVLTEQHVGVTCPTKCTNDKTIQKRRVGEKKVGKVVKFFDYSIFKS